MTHPTFEMISVTKKYDEPTIYHTVDIEGLKLQISLEDYLTALQHELGSPAFILTKASLDSKLRAASAKVIQSVKDESIKTSTSVPT